MHRKVREGYLEIVVKEPERFVKIDASQPLEKVVADTLSVLKKDLSVNFKDNLICQQN